MTYNYTFQFSAPAAVSTGPVSSLGADTFTPAFTIGTGSDYPISAIEGAWDLPQVRTNDTNRPQAHGMRAGNDLLGGRSIVLSVKVTGTSRTDLGTKLDTLRRALTVSSTLRDAVIDIPELGQPLWTQVRVRRMAVTRDAKSGNTAEVHMEFFAPDPFWKSLNKSVANLLAARTADYGSSRAYPRTYPLTFTHTSGVTVADSTAIIVNSGSVDADWEAYISGPCINPTLTNLETGDQLTFSITIPAGSTLFLSSKERLVFLNSSGAFQALTASSRWWSMRPGSTRIRFTAGTASGSAVIRHRSALS